MAQYFNLTLDTQAPSGGELSNLQSYYNGAATVTVNVTNASYMKVWINQTAVGTASDTEIPTSWEAKAGTKTLTPTSEGTNYFHAMFMDEVGNISTVVNSASFIYDITGPTISAIENVPRVKVKTVDVKVSFSDLKTGVDAVSGVDSIKITGTDTHIAEQTFTLDDTDRAKGDKTCTVSLTITDEEEAAKVPVICQFGVVATDRAGNSSSSSSGSVIYDPFPASATMTLMDKTCTSSLAAYVNSYDYGIQITSSDTDIASYKVWEGSSEPTEWETWTGSPLNITNQTFSTGEGLKTIHAKIKDTTGNETTLSDVSTTVDTTAPTVTLSSDVSVISAQTGFNTVTFTLGGTDAHNMPEYELYVDNYKVKNGTFDPATSPVSATVAVTEAEIVAKSAGQGNKSFVLKIKDVAGNWGESSAVTVTVDLTAPTGSITANTYYKAGDAVTVTITGSDNITSQANLKMKVWDSAATEPTDWSAFATSYTFTGLADGSRTANLKLEDEVGNVSTTYTATYTLDTVAPTISSVVLDNVNAGYTKEVNHTATITASDATSGLDKMKVWGDITASSTEPTEWETYSSTKSITLTTGDGIKHVYVKVIDKAGNISTAYDYSVILDQAPGTASIDLYKTDGVTPLPSKVNVRGFVAHIAADDTYEGAGLEYRLTGALDQADPEDTWHTYTEDTGKTYMTISNLTFTEGDGSKTVTVTFRDKAGNTFSAQATHQLDTSAPVVTVTDPNYSIISTQHSKRLDATGSEKAGDTEYNDIVTFKFQANEDYIAYKVCVNAKDQTAAGASAIGTTYGSLNMSGTATVADPFPASTDVGCTLFGKDFAVASGEEATVTGKVIAKEVIIYVQDVAGTWSAIHPIS